VLTVSVPTQLLSGCVCILQLERMLPPSVSLLRESEPAFKYLSKSMRWHYHALSLKEEWLHVQVLTSPQGFHPSAPQVDLPHLGCSQPRTRVCARRLTPAAVEAN